jgi:hypothetical protein
MKAPLQIIRFPEKHIIWLSDNLYKVSTSYDKYKFFTDFNFCFREYEPEIKELGYKHPNLFKGHNFLSSIFNQNIYSLVFDADTGNFSTAAMGKEAEFYLPTSEKVLAEEYEWIGFNSKPTLLRVLRILEKLEFLEVLSKSPGKTRIKLNIEKCNERLTAGDTRRTEAFARCGSSPYEIEECLA